MMALRNSPSLNLRTPLDQLSCPSLVSYRVACRNHLGARATRCAARTESFWLEGNAERHCGDGAFLDGPSSRGERDVEVDPSTARTRIGVFNQPRCDSPHRLVGFPVALAKLGGGADRRWRDALYTRFRVRMDSASRWQ